MVSNTISHFLVHEITEILFLDVAHIVNFCKIATWSFVLQQFLTLVDFSLQGRKTADCDRNLRWQRSSIQYCDTAPWVYWNHCSLVCNLFQTLPWMNKKDKCGERLMLPKKSTYKNVMIYKSTKSLKLCKNNWTKINFYKLIQLYLN